MEEEVLGIREGGKAVWESPLGRGTLPKGRSLTVEHPQAKKQV